MLSEQLSHHEWLRVHQIAAAEVDYRIRQILPEYWEASTPCDEWDIYDLVAHCVIENMRASISAGNSTQTDGSGASGASGAASADSAEDSDEDAGTDKKEEKKKPHRRSTGY